MSETVAAMVLAAGASRRLGQPKQLLTYKGETLIERSIRFATEAGADPIVAVLGAELDRIGALVRATNASVVLNKDWAQGIASSIHAGLGAIERHAPHSAGALILPCDQPRLTAAHLRALIETFIAQQAGSIVASTYAGIAGVPAVFPAAAFTDLRGLTGDKGARALLLAPPCPLIAVPFPGGEIDIDEPEDLDQLA